LLSAEQRYEDSQMIQSALNSHQTRYQCYNILSCLHSMQAVVPLLQKTRHQDLLDHEGKLLNHYELCEELMHEVENAHDYTEVLLKRQQQCEDVIACQQDTITLELKPFDVVHMIKYLWKHNHAKAKKKNLDFILDIEPLSAHRLPIIFQDEFRLRQVIQTFIDNSIAYTSEGAIHLYLGLDTDSIKIHVIDSGCGIDEQVLQASVDKLRIGHLSFSQPKPSAGLGISLSIAQHIINKMGGKLYIYSSDATAASMSSVSSVAESFSGTTQPQAHQAENNVGKFHLLLKNRCQQET
jgi:signal transduction histidine kinase